MSIFWEILKCVNDTGKIFFLVGQYKEIMEHSHLFMKFPIVEPTLFLRVGGSFIIFWGSLCLCIERFESTVIFIRILF